MSEQIQEGEVYLVDKPLEWTSFDVVKKLKYGLKVKKIGHAGTLDPLATGLLILCSGKKTKEINTFMDLEKEYTGTFVLGKTTPSFDLETEVTEVADISHLTEEEIHRATQTFSGEIEQIPPQYSAIKVQGKRAYESARKGENIELKSRKVHIYTFEITKIELPKVHFKVVCSKGTYIRSLARDFGEYLETGAYLSALRRERIGTFHVSNAKLIEEILRDESL